MKNLSYIGSSKKEQQRERTRTLRKSRRLALKRRRQQKQRRTSVGDVLHLTQIGATEITWHKTRLSS